MLWSSDDVGQLLLNLAVRDIRGDEVEDVHSLSASKWADWLIDQVPNVKRDLWFTCAISLLDYAEKRNFHDLETARKRLLPPGERYDAIQRVLRKTRTRAPASLLDMLERLGEALEGKEAY